MSQIKIDNKENVAVIELKGQFIGDNELDELRAILSDYEENNSNNLIINMENVNYLNSLALGVLITSHAHFIKKDRLMVLCNVNKTIEHIFKITKLNLVFTIVDTLEEALKQINK